MDLSYAYLLAHIDLKSLLRDAAWPRGLHTVASTTLSVQTFQTLRAGALKGLKEDHAGSHIGFG